MKKWAYYNENDPFAAQWIRELMKDNLIAPGEVDERDIQDVLPVDVAGFAQCHWFAGIAIWSAALRAAGWPDDRAVFTGSCPCQPFSAAGKRAGTADERHLWPAFFHLIHVCNPPVVLGEQVASADGIAWFDTVQTDLEAAGYAVGAVVAPAAGFGAPHIRHRLYFAGIGLADTPRQQHDGCGRPGQGRRAEYPHGGAVGGLGNPDGGHAGQHALLRGGSQDTTQAGRTDATGGVGDSLCPAGEQHTGELSAPEAGVCSARLQDGRMPVGLEHAGAGMATRPGPVNGVWRAADWLYCRDGKWRPVEPATFPLADAGDFRNRVAELRGAGNSLCLPQAAAFCAAVSAEYVGRCILEKE